MTGAELIADTLRILSVISDAEAPSNDQIQQHVVTLNELLAQWAAEGSELGFQSLSSGNDVVYLPEWAFRPVKYALAAELSLQYARPLDARLETIAREGRALVAKMCSEEPLIDASDLPLGRRPWYNVKTDGY